MMNNSCPVCGSTDLKEKGVTEKIKAPYGPEISFEAIENTCSVCGEEGDFFNKSEDLILSALRESTEVSIDTILNSLNGLEISNAYFERALRLPPRTLARWKNKKLSASSLALLRMVGTYPWLLEVADRDFEPRFAGESLLGAALDKFKDLLTAHKTVTTTLPDQVSTVVENQNGMCLQLSAVISKIKAAKVLERRGPVEGELVRL
jgi:hypothetical protein